ncbi:hypothetical protein Ddye_013405 [Dipteronia dyeriana]|uniref:Uncharacterized protein n=1 Tax=Dipteronia dyeriana TaxID=168575 RepID=A0AAD9X692_9ROSI|nr:hypothetical protein Ddye_013405 [Dipteronia dyeriana]
MERQLKHVSGYSLFFYKPWKEKNPKLYLQIKLKQLLLPLVKCSLILITDSAYGIYFRILQRGCVKFLLSLKHSQKNSKNVYTTQKRLKSLNQNDKLYLMTMDWGKILGWKVYINCMKNGHRSMLGLTLV